jgi:hypothetical protein
VLQQLVDKHGMPVFMKIVFPDKPGSGAPETKP